MLFSYARNSCLRNHQRYRLCGYHFAEEHEGDWREYADCEGEFETEMYVWYRTNEYNFEKLKNLPKYELTKGDCYVRLYGAGCRVTTMGAWSKWPRRHQATAKQCHDKRRAAQKIHLTVVAGLNYFRRRIFAIFIATAGLPSIFSLPDR